MKIRALHAIDKRTAGARAVIKWRETLIAALGGETSVTAAQGALVDVAVRTRWLLDHCDAQLLAMPRLVNRRGELICGYDAEGRLCPLATNGSPSGLQREFDAFPSPPCRWWLLEHLGATIGGRRVCVKSLGHTKT